MEKLQIKYVNPDSLKARKRNPRTHSVQQIRQIARSIRELGFLNPVMIDGENVIIVGHARVTAAKQVGMNDIPTVRVDHLTPEQIRAYVIADNKLAEKAGWNNELLAMEFEELEKLEFDVTLTGFDTAEIDILLGEISETGAEQAEEVPEVDRSIPAISQIGDLWKIGQHSILCGDALDPNSFKVLLGVKKAQMVFTDPPYNVAIAGHVSGLGKKIHREFGMASGEMTSRQFTQFLRTAFAQMSSHSIDGSIHFICMDWRHVGELLDASAGHYSELKNLCVWAKTNAGMGSLYRSQHELIFVFKKGTKPHINNVELGKFGRNRTNLWTYAGVNSFGKGRDEELAMHPTVKPQKLVADAILDCSSRGGIVLDPFSGSGTTLLAAEKTGRYGYGVELDPYYVDLTVQRLEDTYGLRAVNAKTGITFDAANPNLSKRKR